MAIIGQTGGSGITATPPVDDKAIARWDGINGKKIQNSPNTLVQDGGAVEASAHIFDRSVTTEVTVNTGQTWVASGISIDGGSLVIESDGEVIIL